MSHLDLLENKSIHITREAYNQLGNRCMLWSIGKGSTVPLRLARKAFLEMIYGENTKALEAKQTFPNGNASHLECCKALKTIFGIGRFQIWGKIFEKGGVTYAMDLDLYGGEDLADYESIGVLITIQQSEIKARLKSFIEDVSHLSDAGLLVLISTDERNRWISRTGKNNF